MPSWWSRLPSTTRRLLAVAGAAMVVVAAFSAVMLATDGSDDSPVAAAASPTADTTPSESAEPSAEPSGLPADKDEYCPAFEAILAGGSTPDQDEEDSGVDLADLERRFADLEKKYSAAARVSPLPLRDDYRRVLAFLREGQRSVSSRDVDRITALVSNLGTLNDNMAAIEDKSAAFCD